MKISELFEARTEPKKAPASTPPNFIAKHAPRSGAGKHGVKKGGKKGARGEKYTTPPNRMPVDK